MRREDSTRDEASLLQLRADASLVAARSALAVPAGQEAETPALIFEDGDHAAEGDDDLAQVLGAALDEIDEEERQAAVEQMVPTSDVAELTPLLDTWYRRTTRAFICSFDPPLLVSPEPRKHRPRGIVAADRSLEALLSLSLERSRHTFDERRANDVRRNR